MVKLLAVLVFMTGAAALILELAWARWLTLVLGAGAESVSMAVAGVMLGLGLGSHFGGRWADRRERPLRLFGLLELAAAPAALLSSYLLIVLSKTTVAPGTRPLFFAAVLALTAIPCFFKGAAFPALAVWLSRGRTDAGSALGRLYSANTAGAVTGVLAVGFYLFETWGLWRSALTATLLTAAAGAAALHLDSRQGRHTRPKEEAGVPAPPAASYRSAGLWGVAVSGFCVMAYEVLYTRFLVHGLLGTTHALALILAVFLTGLSIGAWFGSRLSFTRKSPLESLGLVLLISAGLALALGPALAEAAALAAFLRDVRWGARLFGEALLAAALLLPAASVMGLAFPLAVKACLSDQRPGQDTGMIFLINSLAGTIGALTAGFVLIPALGLRASLAVTALAEALLGAVLLNSGALLSRGGGAASIKRWSWTACLLLAFFAAHFARAPRLGQSPGQGTLAPQSVLGREKDFRVLCYHEGALATIAVLEHAPTGRRDLLVDGFVTAGDSPEAGYMALMGRLPLRLHPDPKRVLVICFGTGSTARAAAERPGVSLDIVDLEPAVFACASHFSPDNPALLSRSGVHAEDGRLFLRRPGPLYDVITQEPMPPHFAGTSALYSVEYYRLARARLSEQGLLVQWLPLHLTAPRDARQIVAAAQKVFPETWVALAPSDGTGLIVSSPLPLDPRRMKQAEAELKVRFILDPDSARRYTAGAQPVSDDKPALEYSGIDRVRWRFVSSANLQRHNLEEILAAKPL